MSRRMPFARAAGRTVSAAASMTEPSSTFCSSRRSLPEAMRLTSSRSSDLDVEADALREGGGAHRVRGGVDDGAELHVLQLEAELAGGDAAHVEQVVDELDLDVGVPHDRLDRLGPRGLVHLTGL